jgi:nucleoside-diphosphate-sugar epimerase
MNKILITGSSGFIGKHLFSTLSKLKYSVCGFDINNSGDVVDEKTWNHFPKADVVIHLAAKSFVPQSWQYPGDFIKCNVIGTTNALNYCKKNNAKLIFLSSYMYGNPISLPIPESAKLDPTNPYALSKKISEDICQFYCEKFGLDAIILRPFNIYGNGQPVNFLIPQIISQVKNNSEIIIKDSEPKRDFVYINDLINAIIKSIEINIKGYSIFNIGSGVSYSVMELINIIQKLNMSNKPIISTNERRRDEIMDTVADIQKAKNELGWEPEWTLHDGLSQLLNQ